MSLNFPPNPVEGQRYSSDGQTYVRRSGRWVALAYGEADELVREHQIPGRNLLFNPDFKVWQRGSGPFESGYTADRWAYSKSGTVTGNIQRVAWNAGDPRSYGGNILQAVVSASDVASRANIMQPIEGPVSGLVTISVFARVPPGATALNLGVRVRLRTTDVGTLLKEFDYVTLSDNFAWYHVTGELITPSGHTFDASSCTDIVLDFCDDRYGGALAGQTGTIQIGAVKVEHGGVASSFVPRSTAEELSLCQRYFYKRSSYLYAAPYGNGQMAQLNFPVTMRSVPALGYSTIVAGADLSRIYDTHISAYWPGVASPSVASINEPTFDAEL